MDTRLKAIAEKENLQIYNATPLSGGDINAVFALETSSGKLVAKINTAKKFPGMFAKEAAGLERLRSAHAFKIPTVFNYGEVGKESYLLMEKLSAGHKNKQFWGDFAENLARLHRVSAQTFGLEHDNYIGSLPQYNKSKSQNAAEFYIENRLHPQFELAGQNGFTFQALNTFYKTIEKLIPAEKPALVHGDLWGGNYMTAQDGRPALIDPAVAFAPREMDIGMMQLFGGFSPNVFMHYHIIFPMEKHWEERVPLWQLYYLLVHLNLFGAGYLSDVKRIVNRFS